MYHTDASTISKAAEKYAAIVSHNNRNKHYRWLFFSTVLAIVGGKIAIATSQAMRLDKRETAEKHRLWKGAKGASGAAMDNVVAWIKYVPSIFRRLANAACSATLRYGIRLLA